MSQSHPVSNPFGAGPLVGGSDAHNPFQIVGGSSLPSYGPSPFETAAPSQSPFGMPPSQAKVPAPRQQPQAENANPFQIAPDGGQPPTPQEEPPQAAPHQTYLQAGPHQTRGGFEMTGFPTGGPPINQVEPAPLGSTGSAPPPPNADPFAGMDLPQVSDESTRQATEVSPLAEFVVAEPAPGHKPAAPPAAPAPAAAAAPEKAPSFVPSKPKMAEMVTNETKQLELRAIFGVDHELSAQEIMQRARGLPGILQVARISGREAAALEAVHGCASKLGIDEDQPVVMSCPDGFIDFLQAGETALAILRKDDYAPGVRATLIIVARELGKL